MMRVIDILPDSVTQSAAHQHVRNIMLAAGKTSDADSTRDTIRRELDQPVLMVFVGDNRCYRPGLNAVAGREGSAAFKELATVPPGVRPRALRDSFQRLHYQYAIDNSLSA